MVAFPLSGFLVSAWTTPTHSRYAAVTWLPPSLVPVAGMSRKQAQAPVAWVPRPWVVRVPNVLGSG